MKLSGQLKERPPLTNKPGGRAAVVALFDVDLLGDALNENGFDIVEEVEILLDIMRTGKPSDRLAARDALRGLARDNARLHKLMEAGFEADVSNGKLSVTSTTKLISGISETVKALEASLTTAPTIDVEVKVIHDDPKPN